MHVACEVACTHVIESLRVRIVRRQPVFEVRLHGVEELLYPRHESHFAARQQPSQTRAFTQFEGNGEFRMEVFGQTVFMFIGYGGIQRAAGHAVQQVQHVDPGRFLPRQRLEPWQGLQPTGRCHSRGLPQSAGLGAAGDHFHPQPFERLGVARAFPSRARDDELSNFRVHRAPHQCVRYPRGDREARSGEVRAIGAHLGGQFLRGIQDGQCQLHAE